MSKLSLFIYIKFFLLFLCVFIICDSKGQSQSPLRYVKKTAGRSISAANGSPRGTNKYYSESVLVTDDYGFISAPNEDNPNFSSNPNAGVEGTVYVFQKQANGTWDLVDKLYASDGSYDADFGNSLALHNDILVIGADFSLVNNVQNTFTIRSGAVYIFQLQNGTWTEIQKLISSDRQHEDYFGDKVAITENYIAVSSPGNDLDEDGLNPLVNIFGGKGAVYIFNKNNNNTWVEGQKIVSNERTTNDSYYFGLSFALTENYILVSDLGTGKVMRYTNTNNVWSYASEITSQIASSSDDFGESMALDEANNTLVVGAIRYNYNDGTNSFNNSGGAFVFEWNAQTNNWEETQHLEPSNLDVTAFNEFFGSAVAIKGNHMIISAENKFANNELFAGTVYHFEKINNTWTETEIITNQFISSNDNFGSSVSMNDEFVFIGAIGETEDENEQNTFTGAGAAYIYEFNLNVTIEKTVNTPLPTYTWRNKILNASGTYRDTLKKVIYNKYDSIFVLHLTLNTPNVLSSKTILGNQLMRKQKKVDNDRVSGDNFGYSTAIFGDYAVVGALNDDKDENNLNPLNNAGAIFVYKRDAQGNWVLRQKLVADDREENDNLGSMVAIEGDYILASAINNDKDASGANTLSNSGAVYVFKKDGTDNWTQTQKLVPTTRSASDNFGIFIAISNGTAFISSHDSDNAGAVYVFELNAPTSTWTQTQKLVSSTRYNSDNFGNMFALENDKALINVPNRTNRINFVIEAGGVYYFQKNAVTNTWEEIQFFTNDLGIDDSRFGFKLAMNGDYAFISDDNNNIPDDEEQNYLYIYKLNANNRWVKTQTIHQTSNHAASLNFPSYGTYIASEGNTLIVSSIDEMISHENTFYNFIGTVYVYELNTTDGVWYFKQKLYSNSKTNRFDNNSFGHSVSLDNNSVVLGAYNESYDEENLNNINNAGVVYFYCLGIVSQKNINIEANSYSWRGKVLTTSGIYYDTLKNAVNNKCDSVYVLNLSLHDLIDKDLEYLIETKKIITLDHDFGITGNTKTFGTSAKINNNLVLIADAYDNSELYDYFTFTRAGSAQIYEIQDDGTIKHIQKIVPDDRYPYDNFGKSIDILNNTIVVGAPNKGLNYNRINQADGAVYIYERQGDGYWLQKQKLTNNIFKSAFGTDVALNGDFIFASSSIGGGTIYIYSKNTSGVWTKFQEITSSDIATGDEFLQIAVYDNTLIVGAKGEDEDANGQNTLNNAGSVYVFELINNQWTQTQKLVASDRAIEDNFGYSVEIFGNYLYIAAINEDEDANGQNIIANTGSVYIFQKNNFGKWVQIQKIVAKDRVANDNFGEQISVSNNYLLIGSKSNSDENGDNALAQTSKYTGAAYLFERKGTLWTQKQKIVAKDRESGEAFGAVALGENNAVIGAPEKLYKNLIKGAAYYYCFGSLDFDTVTMCGSSFTWRGKTLTTSGNYSDTVKGVAKGCDSVYLLKFTLFNFTTSIISPKQDTTLCADVSLTLKGHSGALTYQWHDGVSVVSTSQNFTITTSDTVKYRLITTSANCSDTAYRKINVNPLPNTTITAPANNSNICKDKVVNFTVSGSDDEYIWLTTPTVTTKLTTFSHKPNNTTTYKVVGKNTTGCKDTAKVTVNVIDYAMKYDTLVKCDSFKWQGKTLKTTGIYRDTVRGVAALGCDSIYLLNLTINKFTNFDITSHTNSSIKACLNVPIEITTSKNAVSYQWNTGETTDKIRLIPVVSGNIEVTGTDNKGCKKTITKNYVVNALPNINIVKPTYKQAFCLGVNAEFEATGGDTYKWSNGNQNSKFQAKVKTNRYFVEGKNSNTECVNYDTVDLDVSYGFLSVTVVACKSFTSPSGKFVWNKAGIYYDTLTVQNGCDSVIEVDLKIKKQVYTNNTIFKKSVCGNFTSPSGKYIWTSSGRYYDTLESIEGCDSVLTFDMTINTRTQASLSVVSCESYASPSTKNIWTKSGIYYDTVSDGNGCQVVLTINLQIEQPNTSSVNVETCKSYTTPNGKIISESGTYTETVKKSKGCDSTITFDVKINKYRYGVKKINTCTSLKLQNNQRVISESGNYMDTIKYENQCDSVITYQVSFKASKTFKIEETACERFNWFSKEYTKSGIYKQVLKNDNNCDSIVELHLTIKRNASSSVEIGGCEEVTYLGQTYSESGIYNKKLKNQNGCDSLITIEVKLEKDDAPKDTRFVCLSTGNETEDSNQMLLFTPNNDGKNDKISFKLPTNNIELYIYNRYGVKMKYLHSTTNIITWDGTTDGDSDIKTGVYLYILKSKDNKIQKSNQVIVVK